MTDRVPPPNATEIEARFKGAAVRCSRPFVLSGIRALRTVRRFRWAGEGLERTLAQVELPVMFAANHVSHADTAAILGTLPRSVRDRTSVAAALDVFGPRDRQSRLKWFRRECLQVVVASGFHAYGFDRHGPPLRSINTTLDLLRRGWSIVLYPEGTRSRTGAMGPFKPGIGLLAKFSGRPVVPIYVHGGLQVLPQGVVLPRAGRITVRYGAPLSFRPGDTPKAFTTRVREEVCALGRTWAETARRQSLDVPPDVSEIRQQTAY